MEPQELKVGDEPVKSSYNSRRVLRTTAVEEFLDGPVSIDEAQRLINADILDSVSLRNGMVMLVDDLGHAKDLPVNYAATFLYHGVCRTGVEWQIRGDVVIVPDADFEVTYG